MESIQSVSVSGDSLTSITTNGGIYVKKSLRVDGCIRIQGTTDYKGIVNIKNENDTIGVDSGALIVDGGISLKKSLYCDGNLTTFGDVYLKKMNGKVNINSNVNILTRSDTALHVHGGILVEKDCEILGTVKVGCIKVCGVKGVSSKFNNIECTDLKSQGEFICTSLSNSGYGIFGGRLESSSLSTGYISGSSCVLTGDLSVINGNFEKTSTRELSVTGGGIVKLQGDVECEGGSVIGKNQCIKGNLLVGGNCDIKGSLIINDDSIQLNKWTKARSLDITGNVDVTENCRIKGEISINGACFLNNDIESVDYKSGSLVVNGGVGIKGNIFTENSLTVKKAAYFESGISVFGSCVVSSTLDSKSSSTGAIIVTGGVGIMKNVNIQGDLTCAGNVKNTGSFCTSSVTTGWLTVNGGVSIHDSLDCSGRVVSLGGIKSMGIMELCNDTESINYQTGGLVIKGGVGISKSVNINQDLSVKKSTSIGQDLSVKGELSIKGLRIKDDNGICCIESNVISGARFSTSQDTNKRYYTSLDLFSLGNKYTDRNIEVLQISNNDEGNFSITARASGKGSVKSLELKCGINGGSIKLHSTGQVEINASSGVRINNGEYTLVLPKSAPPKGVKSMLICNENGELEWSVVGGNGNCSGM